MDYNDENILTPLTPTPFDNTSSGFLSTEENNENTISDEYGQFVGKLKTVTNETINHLPSGFNLNDKYLDAFAGDKRILVNLKELSDVYTAGEGITILNREISNTKTTSWGDIIGNLDEQNDLKNALDTILANADYNNYLPKNQTAEILQKGIVNLDTINQSKGMLTGSVSDDADILKYITTYAHSTFDRSKFTVVGSPVITEDGIASGFSTSNYIKINTFDKNAQNYEIQGKFVTTTSTGLRVIFSEGENSSWYEKGLTLRVNVNKLELKIDDGTNHPILLQSTFNLVTNTDYWYKVICTPTLYTLMLSTDGQTYTTVDEKANTVQRSSNVSEITVGVYTRSSTAYQPFVGSIDLKQFSITVDGVPVFSGNKTGIDTIKPDDYTVVGTPTITPDGIASGFSSSNYVKTTYSFSQQILTNFEIDGEFSLQSGFANFVLSCDSTNNKGVNIMVNSSGLTLYVASSDGTAWAHNSTVVSNLQANKTYIYKILLNNGNLTLDFAEKGSQYVNYPVLSNVTGIYFTGNMYLGYRGVNSSQYLQNGSIDLNAFKIYVDGDLVYQPCLKIPYTESKTGSKIVNEIYRDRVNDMASQFGYASYYTLSDTDFTVPNGEIYGMIGKLEKLAQNEIGLPIPTLSNTLNENEIWLEGAEVSKITYWKLYKIYGDNFGTSINSNNFVLPDFRNRTISGVNTFLENNIFTPYIEAGLPNITGSIFEEIVNSQNQNVGNSSLYYSDFGENSRNINSGNSKTWATLNFDASRSSAVYGNSTTVQPSAIKVRVKTRYK